MVFCSPILHYYQVLVIYYYNFFGFTDLTYKKQSPLKSYLWFNVLSVRQRKRYWITYHKQRCLTHLVKNTREQIQWQALYSVGEQLDGKQRGKTLVCLPEHGRVTSAVYEQSHGVVEEFDGHSAVRVRGICRTFKTQLKRVVFIRRKVNVPSF